MVQQSLNYSSEYYSYSVFKRLFELIHRALELRYQSSVISSHWICKSCGRGLVQSLSLYGAKEDDIALLRHKRFDWT